MRKGSDCDYDKRNISVLGTLVSSKSLSRKSRQEPQALIVFINALVVNFHVNEADLAVSVVSFISSSMG
jgi:hypothetical protein